MGLSYYNKDDHVNAERYFLRALDINPKYINTLNNMGNLKKNLDLDNEALDFYLKSLEVNPKILETHYNIASLYQSMGNFEKAKNHYNECLRLEPKFTKADRNIAMMTNYSVNNDHLNDMKNRIETLKLNDQEKIELHFALGKALDDLDDNENAFFNFEKANSKKKKLTNYDIKNDINLFYNIKKKFSDNQLNQIEPNKRKLIFIVGMPRSGTSLAEQIVWSHKNIYGGGELNFISDKFIHKFMDGGELTEENLPKNFYNEISEFQKFYLSKIASIDNSSKIFIDKAPLNFRWIGLILTIFPNSKIIHCKRNILDNCWSIYKNNFDGNLDFSYNQKDLGNFYNIYQDLMSFWNKKFENKIYNLIYENLINNQELEIKSLIKFCGVEWDSNCLKFYENKKTIKTVSFVQARKPIFKSSINASNKYKNYLKELTSIVKN